MSDFDGTLTPSAGWPDVPQASDVMRLLGGEGGPLNAQAEALAARSELLKARGDGYTHASIRAYTGIENKLLCIGRANVFDGASGWFFHDANNTNGVDNDGTLLVDALGRRWRRQVISPVLPEWFGAKGDSVADDTIPIQKAFDYSRTIKAPVEFGAFIYRTTQTLNMTIGDHYSKHGMILRGAGKASTKIFLDYSNTASPISVLKVVNTDSCYNLEIEGLELDAAVLDAAHANIEVMDGISGMNLKSLRLSKAIHSIHLRDNAWINSFVDLTMTPRDYGIRMDNSGTTNWFDECFVYGSNVCAYKLRGGYSSIGSLAADNCIGTAYDLRFFRGAIGSLGTEQPVQGRVLSKLLQIDHASISIGSVLAFRGVPNTGPSWVGIEVGDGNVTINDFVVDSHDQTAGDKVSSGRLIDGFTGDFKIRNLSIMKDSNGVNPGTLTLAASTLQNTVVSIENPNGTAVAVAGDGHPAIAGSRYNVSPFANITSKGQVVQSIVFDNYGNPKHGGNTLDNKYQFSNGYQAGSIFLENSPARWGCAGYVATNTSSDINGQATIPIAAVNTSVPTAPHVGVSYFDAATNKPYWWNGSVWKDAAGVTKP